MFVRPAKHSIETTSKKRNQTSELNGVELEGIIAGFDPVYQTYTFVEEGMIYFDCISGQWEGESNDGWFDWEDMIEKDIFEEVK